MAESRSHGTAELLFEALLQLAMEAKKQNWQDDLSQRVHDVLAYPSSRDFFVSERSPPLIAQAFTLTAAP